MIYEIGSRGLRQIDVPENSAKNNLPIGTILQLNGYDYPKYVIVKNLGISNRSSSYGATYLSINLNNHRLQQHEALTMKHITEKQDNSIQLYYTDEIMPADEVFTVWQKAQEKETKAQAAKEKSQQIAKEKEAIGRQLFRKHIPETAKALIIAELEVDDCDIQTDYFNTKRENLVILGWSKHTRDFFSEMRKHADKIPETAHLKTPPNINNNGEHKTEQNKSWWYPADEHREKYSMGAGYYLKATGRYSTGWRISKMTKYGSDWDNRCYISLANRCVFEC